jgi:hypothetical protein
MVFFWFYLNLGKFWNKRSFFSKVNQMYGYSYLELRKLTTSSSKMSSRFYLVAVWLFIFANQSVYAQNTSWKFDKIFPDENFHFTSHGVTVDDFGNVWNITHHWSQIDNAIVNPIYIFSPDGEQLDFSPLIGVQTGDTLFRFAPMTGINKGVDGKIYVASHGFRTLSGSVQGQKWNKSKSFIIVIEPTTGEAIELVDVTYMRTDTDSQAPNRPAVTSDGFVALSFVYPDSPVIIMEPSNNWEVINTLTSPKLGFSRSLEISSDGKTIFNPNDGVIDGSESIGHIQVWKSSGIRSEFILDTPLAIGANPGAIARYPNSNVIFFPGGGTNWWVDRNQQYLPNRHYGIDYINKSISETFDWFYESGNDPFKPPRGLAFSDDGQYAYSASYSTGTGIIQRFVRSDLNDSNDYSSFELDLNVSDANSNSKSLRIGTKVDATLGYDADYDLYAPPAPPIGAFDARIISNGEEFYTNYFPSSSEQLEWLISVKASTNGLPLTIQWDPDALLASIQGESCVPQNACFGELMLTDVINGSFLNVDVTKTSEVTITESIITQLKLIYTVSSKYQRQYAAGWNLVGLPLEIAHDSFQDVFPGSMNSTLFAFASGYQSRSSLQPGSGYWLRFQSSTLLEFEGFTIGSKEITLNAGWNLISGLSEAIDLASISDPSTILVANTLFEFNSGYRSVTQLQPGLGYWIRTNASGTIGLSTSPPAKNAPRTLNLDGFDRIEITGRESQVSTLYFGSGYPSGYSAENFSLPPVPPSNIMDLRFEGDAWVSDQSNPTLLVQNLQEGSALRIHPAPDLDAAIQYQVIQHTNEGRQTTLIVKGAESVILSQATQRIEIQRLGDELPVEFTLDQNYPNPFNPTTTIRFGLPESADVSLEVYTVLGQKVMTLVNENRSAGWHTVSFNGGGLSSGVYVYRIRAGGMVQTRKLMLVK